jgi:glutamyl-tRNA synthetase
LNFDAFYKQSERTLIYQKYLNELIKKDKAYVSKESGGDRDEVIRFRNPNKTVTFKDLVRGEISFDTTELGDFVIAKSETEPLYHLAVVVDDYEMGITHVIRGEDGISNTPRQILIQEALGAPTPQYAHLPLILGPDKSKLSKRHGAVSLTEFREKGYLDSAIINHLAMLGWNPGTEQEIFTLDELLKEFSIDKVQKGGAVSNEEKLQWFNHEHLKNLPTKELNDQIKKRMDKFDISDELLSKLSPIILERINVYADIDKMIIEGEFDYYFNDPEYESESLIWKKSDKQQTIKHLKEVSRIITNSSDEDLANSDSVKAIIWPYADENGRGDVLWPLRYCLCGVEKSPDPFTLIYILGKEKSLERIDFALSKLKEA